MQVRDVQEAVPVDADIDKDGLNPRFHIDDAPFVDVSDVRADAGSLHIEFFQRAVLHHGHATLLHLRDID